MAWSPPALERRKWLVEQAREHATILFPPPSRRHRAEAPDLTEAETRDALERLDPLWEEPFPAEQARIVRLLVERGEVGPTGADIRLRVAGLASLVRDLGGVGGGTEIERRKAAA